MRLPCALPISCLPTSCPNNARRSPFKPESPTTSERSSARFGPTVAFSSWHSRVIASIASANSSPNCAHKASTPPTASASNSPVSRRYNKSKSRSRMAFSKNFLQYFRLATIFYSNTSASSRRSSGFLVARSSTNLPTPTPSTPSPKTSRLPRLSSSTSTPLPNGLKGARTMPFARSKPNFIRSRPTCLRSIRSISL